MLDAFAANIRLFSVLSFAPLGANVEAKSFSVRNNAAMGTQIGSIAILGSFADVTWALLAMMRMRVSPSTS